MPKLKESEFQIKDRLYKAEIARQMEFLGIDRITLAKRIGVSRPTIYTKLNNPSKQTLAEMRKICSVLKISSEESGKFI